MWEWFGMLFILTGMMNIEDHWERNVHTLRGLNLVDCVACTLGGHAFGIAPAGTATNLTYFCEDSPKISKEMARRPINAFILVTSGCHQAIELKWLHGEDITKVDRARWTSDYHPSSEELVPKELMTFGRLDQTVMGHWIRKELHQWEHRNNTHKTQREEMDEEAAWRQQVEAAALAEIIMDETEFIVHNITTERSTFTLLTEGIKEMQDEIITEGEKVMEKVTDEIQEIGGEILKQIQG